jgi:uncharacterized protein (DUF983 family)
MCKNLDKKETFDYFANFISGIVGALVIVFALGQENQLNKYWLFIAMIVLFFVGFISLSLFKMIFTKSLKNKPLHFLLRNYPEKMNLATKLTR